VRPGRALSRGEGQQQVGDAPAGVLRLERQRAVELTGGAANAYDALAEIHAARGEWDEAVVASERALEKRPNDNYLRGRLEKFQEGAVANRAPR
jgi:predicted Zn-dependent protease